MTADTSAATPRRYRRAASIVLGCYWLIMFTGTHWPHVSLANYPSHTDKVLHFTGYAGFGFLLGLWITTRRKLLALDFGVAFAVICVYAVFDEVTQPLFGRDCEFFDMVADWTGGLTGLVVFLLVRALFRRASTAREVRSL